MALNADTNLLATDDCSKGLPSGSDDTTVIEALRQANGFRSSVTPVPAITGMRPSARSSVIITHQHVRHDLR